MAWVSIDRPSNLAECRYRRKTRPRLARPRAAPPNRCCMSLTRYRNPLLLALIAATLLALPWNEFGMHKVLSIDAGSTYALSTFDDRREANGKSIARLTRENGQLLLDCAANAGYEYPYCEVAIELKAPPGADHAADPARRPVRPLGRRRVSAAVPADPLARRAHRRRTPAQRNRRERVAGRPACHEQLRGRRIAGRRRLERRHTPRRRSHVPRQAQGPRAGRGACDAGRRQAHRGPAAGVHTP